MPSLIHLNVLGFKKSVTLQSFKRKETRGLPVKSFSLNTINSVTAENNRNKYISSREK